MGWDAHTNGAKNWEDSKIIEPSHDKLFKEASNFVKEKCGSVDLCLDMAGLDCRQCGEMLEKATDMSVFDYVGWNSSLVKELARDANWDFEVAEEDQWAYWSAKKFLECCAEADLEITFSW